MGKKKVGEEDDDDVSDVNVDEPEEVSRGSRRQIYLAACWTSHAVPPRSLDRRTMRRPTT